MIFNRQVTFAATLGLTSAMLLSACGGAAVSTGASQPEGAGTELQVEAPGNTEQLAGLSGEIVADGSSTVYPITSAAAEEFRMHAKSVRISVGVSGTGGGFKRFCAGETDLSNASRPVSPSEIELCAGNNVEFIEIPVAYDGLAVVVNPANTWTDNLTVAELKKIWEPEAQGKITNWSQVRAGFPDKPLKLFGPGTDSGTFDYFTEAIVGKAKSSRGDYQASEDDNALVTGLAGDEGALGYFGLAYYQENADKLKVVAVADEGGEAVVPSVESVKDGSYQPLSRPLFLYIRKDAAARPEVKEFVGFLLSKSFTPLIQSREVGYITLPDEVYAAALDRFNSGTTGTLFPSGSEIGATLDRYLQK